MRNITEITRRQHPLLIPARLKVCAYVRVSTDHQEQLNSLENQTQYYERLISSNPDYHYCGIFSDAGISGAKENRPGFLAMMEQARTGEIDLILTKSISRFARNTLDPMYRPSNKQHNIKRRKDPQERPMLCTDIQIPEGEPELAFIKAWNRLVDEKERYLPECQQAISGNDVLKAYRARELMGLVEETGHIDTMPYELMLKTLDHIEIGIDGKVEVIFLAGIRSSSDRRINPQGWLGC